MSSPHNDPVVTQPTIPSAKQEAPATPTTNDKALERFRPIEDRCMGKNDDHYDQLYLESLYLEDKQ